jgi:hypothetical protein
MAILMSATPPTIKKEGVNHANSRVTGPSTALVATQKNLDSQPYSGAKRGFPVHGISGKKPSVRYS